MELKWLDGSSALFIYRYAHNKNTLKYSRRSVLAGFIFMLLFLTLTS